MTEQSLKCFQQELYEIINHSSFQGAFQNGFYLSTLKVILCVIYSQGLRTPAERERVRERERERVRERESERERDTERRGREREYPL